MTKFTATQILEQLSLKHWQDVFVPECKNGDSRHGHLRLDAWVMKKSWVNPLTIGYEIKVSRADFMGDEKWRGYLAYCNEFYFVCPSGLIQPEELPDGIGLLWLAKTGTRLYRKKKAVYRDNLKPEDEWHLQKYIIMCRTTISGNTWHCDEDRAEYWKLWLAEKDEKKTIGYNVSRKIRQLVEKRIDEVERTQRWLESENKKLAYLRDEMKKLGFSSVPDNWSVDRKLEELNKTLPPDFVRVLESLQRKIGETLKTVQGKTDD